MGDCGAVSCACLLWDLFPCQEADFGGEIAPTESDEEQDLGIFCSPKVKDPKLFPFCPSLSVQTRSQAGDELWRAVGCPAWIPEVPMSLR